MLLFFYTIFIIASLAVHWFTDFVLQRDIDAQNKWKSLRHLQNHVFTYAIVYAALMNILIISIPFFRYMLDIKYVILFYFINGISHFLIDYFTSKITNYLWDTKNTHYFFVMIGFDQLLHTSIIIIFAYILFK